MDEAPDAPAKVNLVWPNSAPVDNEIYGFTDPNNGEATPMVAMTLKTWQRYDAQMRTLTSRLTQLSAENIEMKQGRFPPAPKIVLPDR